MRPDSPHWYLRAFKWWAVGFGAVGALIGLMAITDLIGITRFGYPWFVAPACLTACWIAIRLHRRASADLRLLGR
jgi:hypothetical protein